MRPLWWLLSDRRYLRIIERSEQQLAKFLGVVLLVAMVAAVVELLIGVVEGFITPGSSWIGPKLTQLLGELLNILIAMEVLQNITSYLRRRAVQIELVLLTAITAVARKVIVLPPGAEDKPQMLIGLGVAVLSLAAAYWLVRHNSKLSEPSKTTPATPSQGMDLSQSNGDDVLP